MLAVGVDIFEVERMAEGMERHGARFCDRFFTEQEQAQCEGRAASLAGRFAVKEAVGKALGGNHGTFAAKHRLGAPIADENRLIWADEKIIGGLVMAQGAGADADQPRIPDHRNLNRRQTAHTVPCQDTITGR